MERHVGRDDGAPKKTVPKSYRPAPHEQIKIITKVFGQEWSATMKIDTSGEGTKPVHPEGEWAARVIGSQYKESKTKRPMIVLTFKTSQGTLIHYNVYVDEYPHMFLEPMYALGFDKEYFDDFEWEELADECLKRKANIEVVHEPYMGRLTASVGKVLPHAGQPVVAAKPPKPAPEQLTLLDDDDDDEPF